jgi:multiple sugar transport system permease protein
MANVAAPMTRPSLPTLDVKHNLHNLASVLLVTGLTLALATIFLMPLGYMLASAFKLDTQMSAQNAPLWPARPATFKYQDQEYPLYNVPTEQGVKQYALINGYREDSDVVDPAQPEKGIFNVQGRWRTWSAQYIFSPTLDNFQNAWAEVQFALLYRNTLIIAVVSTIGTLISCIAVAYGFARFRIPGKNLLFIILISTIVLPPQATIIPLYVFFYQARLDGDVAAADGARLFCQRLRRVFAAPIFHDDPQGTG